MTELQLLAEGFAAALSLQNLGFAVIGVLLGTFVGALPGFGPSAGIAILLPLVFVMPPTGGMIMLGAIYYGAMYGNTISSVLLNMPGDAAGVMTAIDGNQMALQGRAGPALGIAAIASFIGGTCAVIALTFLGPMIGGLAVRFGPSEYFGLMILGLSAVAGLTGDAPLKGYTAAFLGLLLSMIGQDAVSYTTRLNFGSVNLLSGIEFVPIIVGLFGISQVLGNLEAKSRGDVLSQKVNFSLRDVLPTREDYGKAWQPILSGTVIGFPVGTLPGAGASIATFLAYAFQKKVSKHPETFGQGAIEGVAAPEAANNAASTGALIPMLSLGIPGSTTTAILLAAIVMWGMQPGPLMFTQRADVVWPFVSSMYIGNVMLLAINLALVPLFVAMLRASAKYINALVGLLAMVGVYSVAYNLFDIWAMLFFGVLGYVMKKLDYPLPPLILAFVLGPLAENTLRQSLAVSGGDLTVFVTRPVTFTLLCLAFVAGVVLPMASAWNRRRLAHGSRSTP